jgi:hypothetical protein
MSKTTITIQIASGILNKQFADDLALDMLSRGYDVRSIAVAQSNGTSQHWEPRYIPAQRVRIAETEGDGYLGTVLEIGASSTQSPLRYRIQWDAADLYGTLWCDENEIEMAVSK